MSSLPLALLAVSALLTAAEVASVLVVLRRRPVSATADGPRVTVLKPLAGADESLEQNLETFFTQRYPGLELVFGVVDPADPAATIARRVAARHPEVRARVVTHAGGRGLNPKVANLRGMLEAGTEDLVLVSDSNVAVSPTYVADMVSTYLSSDRVGMVTSLLRGRGEQTLGAALDHLHLVGTVAGAVALSGVRGAAAVIGKSMLFSRARFEALGGLESVASVLAEDFVMGRMFAEAGYRVLVAREVVDNVSVHTTVHAFLARQLRWSLMRSRVMPGLYALEWLHSPLAAAIVAVLAGAPVAALALGAALVLARDAILWLRLRGHEGVIRALPLSLPKEALVFAVWALAPLQREVRWRGRRLRVSTGTRLYALAPGPNKSPGAT